MKRGSSIYVTCPLCNVSKGSLASYIAHLQDEHQKSQTELQCPSCSKIYNRKNLYSHYHSCSSSQPKQTLCRKCMTLIDSHKLLSHFKMHVMKNEYFMCPFRNCSFSFGGEGKNAARVMTLFKRHSSDEHEGDDEENVEDMMSIQHREAVSARQDILESFRDPQEAEDHDEFQFDVDDGDAHLEGESEGAADREAFEEKFLSFIFKKSFVELLPERVINELITTLSNLAEESSKNLLLKLKNKLPDRQKEVEEVFASEDWLKDCLTQSDVKTHFMRARKADSLLNITSPQFITSFPNLQGSTSAHILRLNVKDILLRELEETNWDPEKNFGLPEDFDYIKTLKSKDPEILSSFRDSQRYKDVLADVPIEQQPPVLLEVYADALDRDSMGFTSGRNKIHITCIRNIGLHDGQPRSPNHYKVIQLMNENVKSANQYEEVMKPLVEDLKTLIEEGLFYRGKYFAVRLVHLQGDGKERAAMYGMCDSFSAVSHCDPWSYLTRKTRINAKNVREIVKEAKIERTKESYDVDIANIEGRIKHARKLHLKKLKLKRLTKQAKAIENSGGSTNRTKRSATVAKLQSKYFYSRGLKYTSPWNLVPFFHVAQKGALIPCTSHDLYAGAFRTDLARIFVSLCNAGYFVWKGLQKQFRLKRLALKFEDRTNWHDQVCEKNNFKKLPGKHASVHMIIRYASTFWMHRDTKDDMFKTTAWKMYLTMKKIAELVSAKVVSQKNRLDLRQQVSNYIDMKLKFIEEHKDIKWLSDPCSPKHLWMIHYFNAVNFSGPLCHLETNIAESKNGQLRKHSTKSNQTKNVLKTIFTRELRKSAVLHWTRKSNEESDQHQIISKTKITKKRKEAFTEAGVLLEEVVILKYIDQYNYRFRSLEDQVIAHGDEMFSELLYILLHKRTKKMKLLVRPLEVEFKKHLGLYFIKDKKPAKLFEFKNLTSSKPIYIYKGQCVGSTLSNYFSLHESLPY